MTADATPLELEIARRLEAVRQRMAFAAHNAGRSPQTVQLVAVSKRQPAEKLVAAVKAGVRVLGENYVKEGLEKRQQVDAWLEEQAIALPQWHMIGHVQRRKARLVVEHFDAVESLDPEELADELDRRAERAGSRMKVLLQVNLSGEAQKNGVAEGAVEELAAHCLERRHLEPVGLMTVPAANPDPEASRANFARLREVRDRLQQRPGAEAIQELSMGMSGDFEIAIEEGATLIRVGTALFGPRDDSA